MNKVFFEHFSTLENLIDTIEKRPYNKLFADRENLASQRTDQEEWFETKDYNESIELVKNGYMKPLEEMKREVLKVNKQTPQAKPRTYQSVVGYAPHVPNAIQGIPTSMISRERTREKTKTIHLLYGFSAVGATTARDLIKGGTNFIGLVNSLEKAGYRVKIDLVRCTTSKTSAIGYTVNVKQYSQPLNLLKLCYPLVHPSMLRRTSFKYTETLPNLKDRHYVGTMGTSLIARLGWFKNPKQACKLEREFLEKHDIIKGKNSYYCNVYEAMDAASVNDLAQKMGL